MLTAKQYPAYVFAKATKNILEVRLLNPNYAFKVVLFVRKAVVFLGHAMEIIHRVCMSDCASICEIFISH